MAQERSMKIVLLGDTGAGKTSVGKALTGEKFEKKDRPMFDAGHGTLNTKVSHEGVETLIKQEIWDIPKTEVNAFIFVVDSTKPLPDPNSKPEPEILKQLEAAKKSSPNAKFYIAVNKYDEYDEKKNPLDVDSLKLFASRAKGVTVLNDQIVFCSAKTGQNIGSLFDKVTGDFCKKLGEGPYQILGTHNASPVIESSPLKNALDWTKEKAYQLTGSKAWTKSSYLLELGAATLTDLARNVTNGVLKAGETVVQTVSEIYNNLVKEKPAQNPSKIVDEPKGDRVSLANPTYKPSSAPPSTQSNLDSTPGTKLENENKDSKTLGL